MNQSLIKECRDKLAWHRAMAQYFHCLGSPKAAAVFERNAKYLNNYMVRNGVRP